MTDTTDAFLGQIRTGWVVATKSNLKQFADHESNEPQAFEISMICTSTVATDGPHTTWAVIDRDTLPIEYFGHLNQPPVPYPCKTEADAWMEFVHSVSEQMAECQAMLEERVHEFRVLRQHAFAQAQKLAQPRPKKKETAHANA